MNKQEVIEKIEASKYSEFIYEFDGWEEEKFFNRGLDCALFYVNQLDEPEKPVVPQFVAEYIEYCKHERFYTLYGAYANMGARLKCWRFEGNNSDLFAKAWLYGYEVEKEKLYTVELPNSNNLDYLMLQKDRRGKISVAWYCTDSWREDERVRLTEAEIKKDFDWAWQFAKEVEEND